MVLWTPRRWTRLGRHEREGPGANRLKRLGYDVKVLIADEAQREVHLLRLHKSYARLWLGEES